MKQIPLTQGKFTLVSDHRFEFLNQWKWHVTTKNGSKWYAVRKEGWPIQKTIKMHRQIMGVTDPKIEVDHRDGDGLNNVDNNLRVSTNAQNLSNRGKQQNNTTGFKGVCLYEGKYFTARICVNKRMIYLGGYGTPEEAAHAYDEAAKKYHGEFAWLNFPDQT